MGYLTDMESGVICRRLGPVVIQWCDGACGDPSSDVLRGVGDTGAPRFKNGCLGLTVACFRQADESFCCTYLYNSKRFAIVHPSQQRTQRSNEMSHTASKLNEVRNRTASNEVCEAIQWSTLRLLAARIFSGMYF
jgi:hypothetical protein